MGVLPEKVVKKNLGNKTQYSLSVESYNRQDPRGNYKYCFLELRYPIQQETVESDTCFPKIKSSQGNTCSHFFFGTISDR